MDETNQFLDDRRWDYASQDLQPQDLTEDPFDLFMRWWEDTKIHNIQEPAAMALATSTKTGRPSCRTVLMRGISEQGFLFFTNYESRKGVQLNDNPFAAAVLYWKELDRQICIEGSIEKTNREISQAYFSRRPRGGRLSAVASLQSRTISSYTPLEEEIKRLEKLYEGQDIPLPSHWGGYRLIPTEIEFWQGRPDRLHRRYRYVNTDSGWEIRCLAP
jgi:pyridoxamine 5'-phosphate oxidase